MSQVYELIGNEERDFDKWDALLCKNADLQAGPWTAMSREEKKAAYYLAWGPVEQPNSEFNQKVLLYTLGFLGLTVGIYYTLLKYFRSQKELPTLTPEWKEATRKRLIRERAQPYTGESAHLFTKDGIKEE